MGCIPLRHRKNQGNTRREPPLPPLPSPIKKITSFKTENLTTLASNFQKEKKQVALLPSISKLNNFRPCPNLSSLNSFSARKSSSSYLSILTPELTHESIEFDCEKKNLSLYIQMSHGYPSENIVWLEDKSGNSAGMKNELFILTNNANVFAKFKVQCLSCKKINNFTTCKTVFQIPSGFCNCDKEIKKLSVLNLTPKNAQIWSDSLKEPLIDGGSFEMREGSKQNTFRIIGCTSCWKFQNLIKREQCGCAVCENCKQNMCQSCY